MFSVKLTEQAQLHSGLVQFFFFYFTFWIFFLAAKDMTTRSIRGRDFCVLVLSCACSGTSNTRLQKSTALTYLGFNLAACNTIILSVLGLKKDSDESFQKVFTLYVAIFVFILELFFVLFSIW